MAGYECAGCGGARPPVVIYTSLVTGATVSSCAEDLAPMLIGLLAVELQADSGALYEAVRAHLEASSAALAAPDGPAPAAAGTAGRKPARRRKTSPPADELAGDGSPPDEVVCPGCGERIDPPDGNMAGAMIAHEGACEQLQALLAAAAGAGAGAAEAGQ